MSCQEPTNQERAERVRSTMDAYCWKLDQRSFSYDEDDVKDLLTDLMHLCAQEGIDFDANLRIARNNFEAEQEEDES